MPESGQVMFLHGGPGLSAALERQRFGNTLPVQWWDQPHVDADVSVPFERLVEAAEKELGRLFDAQEQPVALLANSFGVHLALALIERVPERVRSLDILGGTLNMRMAFVRLAERISEVNRDADLKAVSDRAQERGDSESLWALIEKLFTVGNLLDSYWGPGAQEQCESMKALAASGALVHAATFQAALADFIERKPAAPPTFSGSVRVLVGRFDPYARADDAGMWRAVFPKASVEFVEAGHFPHLELPAKVWMPVI
jgi:pimeloyl-ACP methyl ester carboxylesterase